MRVQFLQTRVQSLQIRLLARQHRFCSITQRSGAPSWCPGGSSPAPPADLVRTTQQMSLLLQAEAVAMDADGPGAGGAGSAGAAQASGASHKPAGLLPEVEIYIVLLVTVFLVDHQQFEQVGLPGTCRQRCPSSQSAARSDLDVAVYGWLHFPLLIWHSRLLQGPF